MDNLADKIAQLNDLRPTFGDQLVGLPPRPEAIRRALANYLNTLLERYQFFSLPGIGISGDQQVHIALRSVFINSRTNVTITLATSEAAVLFSMDSEAGRGMQRGRRSTLQASTISPELRQWLAELLPADQQNQVLEHLLAPRTTLELPPADQQDALLGRSRPTDGVDLDQVRERLLAPRTALELIRHHHALVLLGDPGSGKTTVLHRLALGFAYTRLYAGEVDTSVDPELAWNGPLPLPILVQLRRFADELTTEPANAGPLLDHIDWVLSGDRLGPLADHLQDRLEAGEMLVLCDGLDEIADDTQRAWASRAIKLFQSRYPHSRIVLTSRPYAHRESYQLSHSFQVATLQPLDQAAQDDFIMRWYPATLLQSSELPDDEQEQAAITKARDLADALEHCPRLREIASNPLLLTRIALVHQHRLRLPQQRARLYEECLLLLLEQWEQHRAEGGPAGLAVTLGMPDQIDRLALIQPIAYELQSRDREEASGREVRGWSLERFLDLAQGDGTQARALIERFLDFLEGCTGLLIARGIKDRYAFPHKTFQEYLAARELIGQGLQLMQAAVAAQRHAPAWREVILLVAGHLAGEQPQVARALAWRLLEADAEGTPAFYRSATLAGEIVEELGSMLGREGQLLEEGVTQALVALVQRGQLNARERVEAAFLLGRMGDPRLPGPKQPIYWCVIEAGSFWHGDDRTRGCSRSSCRMATRSRATL